ncbi:hypothetical protein FKM82_014610 [Ascaphus truei]
MDKNSLSKEMHCLKNNDAHKVSGNQTLALMIPLEGSPRSRVNKPSTLSNTLDLSRKKLHSLSEDLYKSMPYIQNLHLEGNYLFSIPKDLFVQLPHLVWLDLRSNKITSLPLTIGDHRQLKYLLLEGNPIKALPVELGDLTSLKALNLRHCPLEFPPEDIVHKGLESILLFLRNARREDLSCYESGESDMPSVEKLKLNELMKSSLELSEEWESKEERLQFEMLKNRIMQEEMKEMMQGQTFARQATPRGAASLTKSDTRNFLSDSRSAVLREAREPETGRYAEVKERLAAINQKKKDQEALKEWRKQTKIIQDQITKSKKTKESNLKLPMSTPYAIHLDTYQKMDNCDKLKPLVVEKQTRMPRIMSVKSLKEMEKARASRDLRLEHRIRQHTQTMQERNKKPKGTAQEEMETSKKDLETAKLLHAELLQRKREQETPLEYRFTAFTGETSPSQSPRGKPQNIFAMSY